MDSIYIHSQSSQPEPARHATYTMANQLRPGISTPDYSREFGGTSCQSDQNPSEISQSHSDNQNSGVCSHGINTNENVWPLQQSKDNNSSKWSLEGQWILDCN